MKSTLKRTKHSKIRQAQRAIKNDVIDVVLELGEDYLVKGGATKTMIPEDVLTSQIDYFQRQLNALKKASGVAVVICENSMLSVMHQTKKIQFN